MVVTHKETLQFYDHNILFEAEDEKGRRYIAVDDGEDETSLQYKLAPVGEKAMIKFKEGYIDLRALMMTAPHGEWYRATIGAGTQEIQVAKQESALVIAEDMPESGCYLLRFKVDRESYSGTPGST